MTFASDTVAGNLSRVALVLVGIVFVWTGAIKTFAPHIFRAHLASFGWIPHRFLSTSVTAAAALETGWGVALILNISPRVAIPVSIALLAALSLISWWGVKTGKTEDCGCYGGFIQPSMYQSLGLNFIFVGFLVIAWILAPVSLGSRAWQWVVVASIALLSGVISEWAQRFEAKTGSPKFTSSPLKQGAKWKHSWAHNATRGVAGEMIVAMLGPDCPYCKQWVKVGNAMTESPALPKVYGVVGVSPHKRDAFVADHLIRFPVASISPSLMNRLAQAIPTAVLVNDGRIREIWIGSMPPEFVERFRRAFFPDALVERTKELTAEAAT